MFDGAFSIWHIALVAVVGVLLFYKGDKLPDAARSVGRSLRVFKTEIKGLADDDRARDEARDAARQDGRSDMHDVARDDAAPGGVGMTKAESPRAAIEAPSAPAPRVIAEPSSAIPVRAEIIREPAAAGSDSRPRPRPRPAGSSAPR